MACTTPTPSMSAMTGGLPAKCRHDRTNRRASVLGCRLHEQPKKKKKKDISRAESRGLLARATGQRAYTIARQGTPELIAAHRADILSDEAATQIAQAAPNDARLQALGVKLVQSGKSIALAQNTMRAVQTLAPSQASGDLFWMDDSAMKDAEKMAAAAPAKQRDIDDVSARRRAGVTSLWIEWLLMPRLHRDQRPGPAKGAWGFALKSARRLPANTARPSGEAVKCLQRLEYTGARSWTRTNDPLINSQVL